MLNNYNRMLMHSEYSCKFKDTELYENKLVLSSSMFCLDDYHSFNAAIMQARSDDTMYRWSCRKLINVFTDGDTAVKPKLQQ